MENIQILKIFCTGTKSRKYKVNTIFIRKESYCNIILFIRKESNTSVVFFEVKDFKINIKINLRVYSHSCCSLYSPTEEAGRFIHVLQSCVMIGPQVERWTIIFISWLIKMIWRYLMCNFSKSTRGMEVRRRRWWNRLYDHLSWSEFCKVKIDIEPVVKGNLWPSLGESSYPRSVPCCNRFVILVCLCKLNSVS